MHIGNQIKQVRQRKGITQSELADKSQLTQAYISLIESGRKNPTYRTLEAIAQALNCSISELVSENGEKTAINI